jgi:hypothetical protein
MRGIINCAVLAVVVLCGLGPIVEPVRASVSEPGARESNAKSDPAGARRAAFEVPRLWEYTSVLIAPEERDSNPSRAQKDPTVVFYFTPHKKWYLVYRMGVPGASKMWVAYSTTADIAQPHSWTQAMPILDGGENDPRQVGGLDYWIICDSRRAYLFLTIDLGNLRFLFQGMRDKDKSGKGYGQFQWRLGMLTPVPAAAARD